MGDEIWNMERKLSVTRAPKSDPVDIKFNDLYFSVSKGCKKEYQSILKGVNGLFRSGELTAIMGPSGAGKSTLMNILAGYKSSDVTGKVFINGRERIMEDFRKDSCYIMQDDCLMPHLSVQEAMLVSVNLKLRNLSNLEKKHEVTDILESIGLIKAISTKTINLSGGQRKRLAIALELVNNPPVMFFDEPTSGLDSSSSSLLVSLMQNLAQGGRTIVCTIHQPSARLFEMFNQLYMLSEGQCMYQGRVDNLVPFLTSYNYVCPKYYNPADYVMEVACGEYGSAATELVNHMTSIYNEASNAVSEENVSPETPLPSNQTKSLTTWLKKRTYPVSEWKQFWILLIRSFKSIVRDKQLMHMRLASHVVVGAIIGMIYFKIGTKAGKSFNNLGCLFFIMLFTMFTGLMPTILTFPQEMGVFVREHLNHWYSLKAFYFAKTVADIPFQILFSGAFAVAVYYLTGQPNEIHRMIMFVGICVLTSLVAQSLGLVLGAGLSVETAVYIGPVMCIPSILFSGYLVTFDVIPGYLKWLTYVSFVRYGLEGAVVAIYKDRVSLNCLLEFVCKQSNVLETLGMEDSEYWIDAVALLSIFIGLRILGYFVLLFKVYSLR